MSFEIPEQAKYRLTGGFILIILAFFILPGLMKKSNQRFEESMSQHLKVPPKPPAPHFNIPTQNQVFHAVAPKTKPQEPKVAEREVDLHLSKAAPLELGIVTVEKSPPPVKVLPVKKTMAQALPKQAYALQLASFAHQENADFLIKRLKKMGHQGKILKLSTEKGVWYQVLVAKIENKDKALALQKQLAENLKLEGMIINKELS